MYNIDCLLLYEYDFTKDAKIVNISQYKLVLNLVNKGT